MPRNDRFSTMVRSDLEKEARKLGVATAGRNMDQIRRAIRRKKTGKKRKGKLN